MSESRPLRIAVADDEPDTLLFFRELLLRLGHEVVAEATNGSELVERCRGNRPDLIITDVLMPDKDGLQAVADINREVGVPVVLVTGHPEADILNRGGAEYIMACLTKPVRLTDVAAAVRLAMVRHEHFQALAREAASLRQALEDRKLIERAKGTVMKRLRVEEEEAFYRMRKLASDSNRKIVEIAQRIVGAEEVFRQLEHG